MTRALSVLFNWQGALVALFNVSFEGPFSEPSGPLPERFSAPCFVPPHLVPPVPIARDVGAPSLLWRWRLLCCRTFPWLSCCFSNCAFSDSPIEHEPILAQPRSSERSSETSGRTASASAFGFLVESNPRWDIFWCSRSLVSDSYEALHKLHRSRPIAGCDKRAPLLGSLFSCRHDLPAQLAEHREMAKLPLLMTRLIKIGS